MDQPFSLLPVNMEATACTPCALSGVRRTGCGAELVPLTGCVPLASLSFCHPSPFVMVVRDEGRCPRYQGGP